MPPYLNPKPRRRHTEKLCIKFLFLIMLWVLQPQFVFALTDAEEYEIKAVYLFNLGHFIRWKDNIVAEDFEICVFGENPFGINLEYIIDKEKKIQNRNVALRQLSQINEIDNCHILFMSHTAQPQFETIFAAIRNKPILTVGDTEHFVIQGGMVQFYRREGKIRLMIDPQTFEDSGLKPSSHLMGIAQLVKK